MSTTLMSQETKEAAEVLRRQIVNNRNILNDLRQRIKEFQPYFVVTIGRGSSDHACMFAKYLFETKLGLITSSAAPSTVTVYDANLSFAKSLVIGISQSGRSPDICKMMEVARKQGAITVAIVNVVDSPLAHIAEFVVPMWCGEEKAVAATKSYIASLAVLTNLIATLLDNQSLLDDFRHLSDILEANSSMLWPAFIHNFRNVNNTLIIGRGYGFPIALEAALKCKETASIQAEAFSAAELLHGPLALIKRDHPYLLLAQNDKTFKEILMLASRIKDLGGKSLLLLPEGIVGEDVLKQHVSEFLIVPCQHKVDVIFNPIIIIQTLYLLIAELAVKRGYNPDAPANLRKVTETL
jgi:glutamine---fructose-6-phosphate transaminase (isomerizing)